MALLPSSTSVSPSVLFLSSPVQALLLASILVRMQKGLETGGCDTLQQTQEGVLDHLFQKGVMNWKEITEDPVHHESTHIRASDSDRE
jgi:hypothetical protein